MNPYDFAAYGLDPSAAAMLQAQQQAAAQQQAQAQHLATAQGQHEAMMVRAFRQALADHDQYRKEVAAWEREQAKGRHPYHTGNSGMQLVTTDATNPGNGVTVMEQDYDARPYEGCEGSAILHVRVIDQVDTGLPRGNAKLMLEVRCGMGTSGMVIPSVDATNGCKLSVPAAGSISVVAFFEPADGGPFIARTSMSVEAMLTWGNEHVPAMQTLRGITLAAGVQSAFVEIPQQARYATCTTNLPGRSGNLEMFFATDPAAADIKYSQLAPNLNPVAIHSGVKFVAFTGDAIQLVIPQFETW